MVNHPNRSTIARACKTHGAEAARAYNHRLVTAQTMDSALRAAMDGWAYASVMGRLPKPDAACVEAAARVLSVCYADIAFDDEYSTNLSGRGAFYEWGMDGCPSY